MFGHTWPGSGGRVLKTAPGERGFSTLGCCQKDWGRERIFMGRGSFLCLDLGTGVRGRKQKGEREERWRRRVKKGSKYEFKWKIRNTREERRYQEGGMKEV